MFCFAHTTRAHYIDDSFICPLQKKASEAAAKETKAVAIQVDDVISFRQFAKKAGTDGLDDVSPCVSLGRFIVLMVI